MGVKPTWSELQRMSAPVLKTWLVELKLTADNSIWDAVPVAVEEPDGREHSGVHT
jgi:hypothetical protein